MITLNDVLDALETKVHEVLPADKAIHRNLLPKNAERPCSLLECEGATVNQVNAGLYELAIAVKITALTMTDERHYSHLDDLYTKMMALLGIFSDGFLRVEDRALKVQSCGGTSDYDFAEVNATLAVTLAKEDLEAGSIPMMQELFLQIKHKDGGNLWQP